jgi:hypothetical protein
MTSCATFGERLRAEWVLTIDLCAGREGIGMRFGSDASPRHPAGTEITGEEDNDESSRPGEAALLNTVPSKSAFSVLSVLSVV